ncbi:proprotein convertase P-domain-containing protein, partial [Aureibaculum conchae]|uniref:proprotein convertase P-domain-containing protein n=1 Tax=Aureibaculum sp. 2308TA14-22 TaxID=3108392 RepID=UPI003399EA43
MNNLRIVATTVLFLLMSLNSIGQVCTTQTWNTGVAIPDNNATGVSRTVNFTSTAAVNDVNVTVNITHTWDSDLIISLQSPAGTTVILSNRNGSSGDNYATTVFDDAAGTAITAGSAPFNGTFIPEAALSAFNGENPSGNWTLTVSDNAAFDTGTLNSFSVEVCSAAVDPCTDVAGIDTDGDGINDVCDLDDDNDGMTDEEEYCTTANTAFLVSQDVGTRSVVVNHTDTGYLRLDFSSMDNSFQLDINGTTVHPSILEFENGALGAGEEYFLFQSDLSFIASPWVANVNGLPRLRLIVDEAGDVVLYGTRSTTSTTLELMQAQAGTAFNTINWVSGANNTFTITNQAGPGPEGFTGELFVSVICDDDGDGVINSKDLDSDNDGIYDIVESSVLDEAGVNDANNDGVIDGAAATFGNNGLFSGIEDNDFDFANLTYTIADSDSDGIYDPYELDADDDGCNDVTEAGYTDGDSNGLLGSGTFGSGLTVDGDGLVTSGVDGYTTPDDNDSNGDYDFQQAFDVVITAQPPNRSICETDNTTFTVTATGSGLSYQWQISTGGAFSNLSNGGVYSNVTTNTLNITNAPISLNGNQYRVIVSSSANICTSVTTSAGTLTVQAQPDAGTNGTLTVCEGTTPTDAELFAELGGTPDAGGTWSNVGLVYTYTVAATAPCTGNDTATVTVTEQAQPDAGTNGTLTVCEGTTPTDAELFAELGGTPDAGGTWSN